MIRHIFRLIWNRKGSNFLILTEIFLSFIVLFAISTMVVESLRGYLRPIGFSYEDVWVVNVSPPGGPQGMESDENLRPTYVQMLNDLRSSNEVEYVTWASSNLPYGRSQWINDLTINDREISSNIFLADDDFAGVLRMPVLEGRWFSREDDASAEEPIVINGQLREEAFGNGPAVGQKITTERHNYRVVGVVGNYLYQGEFAPAKNGFFVRNHIEGEGSTGMIDMILRVRPGTGVAFEQRLIKDLQAIGRGWTFKLTTLSDMRAAYFRDHLLSLLTYALVAGFLVLNVALGLFGVVWYSINRRRSEIGLRRAVGADASRVSRQILGESLVLATLAIVVGVFIALQAPILGLFGSISLTVYLGGMALAALIVYLIVSICAWYPSRLAAKIRPATALHEE